MRLILKNGMSVLYKNGMSLTGLNIDSIVAESKEDRADLRMLLMGALKVDESGCHQLGRGFGSNALVENSDASNGSVALGVDSSNVGLSELLKVSALDVKLQAINSLTAILNADGHFDVKNAASKKLNLLIQEI
ncbi:MAG: hypothetical protein RSE38_13690 [Acinetobacter sp.]